MPHTEDIEAHIKSIHEDTLYWGRKRVEARIFRMIRENKISFYEFLKASSEIPQTPSSSKSSSEHEEEKIAALEIKLGDLIRGINIATSLVFDQLPIEEFREEYGTYDPSFKFARRELAGTIDERLGQLEQMITEYLILLEAFFKILINRGVISEKRLREMLAASNPPRFENGARIVAKAWTDADFKEKLLSDAKTTLRELDFALNRTPKLVVLENTESVHNVIVCTLCSCYPYELLGNAPWWYKNDEYKEAIVQNPRGVLHERFKFDIPESTEVRVYDSTSDIRYMVLPKRPDDTNGMGMEELSSLVTEDSLIGVGDVLKAPLSGALIA
jgi:nitrile hydratase subunit alpha